MLSYVGEFGKGLGTLAIGWGELPCLALTIIVSAVGVATRLTPRSVVDKVESTRQVSAEVPERK